MNFKDTKRREYPAFFYAELPVCVDLTPVKLLNSWQMPYNVISQPAKK